MSGGGSRSGRSEKRSSMKTFSVRIDPDGALVSIQPSSVAYLRSGYSPEVTQIHFAGDEQAITVNGSMREITNALDEALQFNIG